jgi:Tfp pilus assembly protein PilN
MIILNLLSPKHKRELQLERIFITIKELSMLILLFVSITGIFLVGSRYFLEQQLANLVIKNQDQLRAHEEISGRVILVNKKISYIESIQDDFKKWSIFLLDTSDLINDGIHLNLLRIYNTEQTLNIKGIADTREALTAFKNELEESDYFNEVHLPLNNLLARENNAFDIRAEINSNKKF